MVMNLSTDNEYFHEAMIKSHGFLNVLETSQNWHYFTSSIIYQDI